MRRAFVGGWIVIACATLASAQEFPATTPPPSANWVPATPSASMPATPPPAKPEATAAPAPAPLATRQTTFTIPFSVDPRAASEVQLHVSSDQGKTWSLYSRQRPDAKQFLFRAAEDGEYWFASRTIDPQGRGAGDGLLTPELRVRVDTTTPKTDLTARVGSNGEIIATWQASDVDLVAESVQIEYQAAGDRQWQSVVLDPAKTKQEATGLSGEATWFPRTNHRAINLRIVARDGAGNSAMINRGVYLPASQAPAKSNPRSPAPLNVDPFRRDVEKIGDKPPQKWPSEQPPDAAKPSEIASSAADALPTFKPVAAPIEGAVAGPADGQAFERPPVRSFDPPPPPQSVAPAPRIPDPATARQDVPPGEQPSFTTKRRFKLDYDADDVPLEQIADVELWGTHDAGKTWLKWGVDPDRQSPFEVEVDKEGVFGFRVVIVHQNGMAGHTPRAGDAADIWIGVDGTAPLAKFGSVAYGKGHSSGQLEIHWTASDDWLATRPVTLSYATDPQGPWTTIATGLANTGQYFWRVEPSVPRRVYLRLEVRDHAGNVTEDRLAEIIELEGLVPRGKIRGLEIEQ